MHHLSFSPFFHQLVCHQVATLATTPPSLPGTRTPQRPTVPPPLCTLPCRRPPSLTLKHLSHTIRWAEEQESLTGLLTIGCHVCEESLSSLSNLHPHLLATCWSGSGPAEPVPGCHEPPVQHPGGPESGQPVAGEEPAATDRHPCPHAMSPTGPAEGQLQPRVSHSMVAFSLTTQGKVWRWHWLHILTYKPPPSYVSSEFSVVH